MHPVIFVVGPTACGKSQLALELAQHFSGAILNCDSLQVYKRLDIGTAKPTQDERQKIPHYLFDVLDPGDVLTAGDYRRLALTELQARLPERMIFAVGGSGFYIQALEKGMFEVDKPTPEIEHKVREQLAANGLENLYAELKTLDPESAEDISPNDSYRIVRALVVLHDSGRKMSDLKKQFQPEKLPFPYLKLGLNLNRETLLPRVTERTRKMLDSGLLQEVERLLRDGYEAWPALHSVGYKECVDHLRGRLSLEQLAPKIIEKTMQLAKKQRTWFKRDQDIQWLKPENPVQQAIQYVNNIERCSE